jgi:purine-nucleoside phosphorylase
MTQPPLGIKVAEAAEAIRSRIKTRPRFGVTLGTGLSGLTGEIDVEVRIPYAEVPWFPEPRVASHQGTIVAGKLGGQPVIALEGRGHFYEGFTLEEITLPVRVLKELGAECAIFSNAAGGLAPSLRAGDILIIEDHLNPHGREPARRAER